MANRFQNTISQPVAFEGRGLHTGAHVHMRLLPAPADSGVRFVRTDLGGLAIPALAGNVVSTRRCTTIGVEGGSVSTVEHVLSALTGMGIDNATVEIDGPETPILDGSALPYVEEILKAGITELDAPRQYVELSKALTISSERTGSMIKLEPCDRLEISLTADFDSRVLGKQEVRWSEGDDYARELAPCRTFVFFHEIEALARAGLVKGGTVDNAIVIMEREAPQRSVDSVCDLLGLPRCKATPAGYLDNVSLHFPDECGRHKLLDLLGDLRLCGGFLHARVSAFRPGHTINTQSAAAIIEAINSK